MLDSLWRALAYSLHPRVIKLSFMPLLLAGAVLGGLTWWGWADGVALVRHGLDTWSLSGAMLQWLDSVGLGGLRAALVPLLLVLLAVPLVLIVCLLLVANLMTPAMVKLVRQRRFAGISSTQETSWLRSLGWSLRTSLKALAAMIVTAPLWFVPLVAMILPPLIWGWLTYRVMAFDALADVASASEREQLLTSHRSSLLIMGVVCGYLGAAPAALWALGALTVYLAPLMLLASVWIYTLVFAFSSLWFTHYLLSALSTLRATATPVYPITPGAI
ncbi:MAG: EI24 domain-containing protein [Aquabacterium sp.]|nr:EI24 domain-containing protein [Aquabacterium sp.]